jgi:hypothetical protein
VAGVAITNAADHQIEPRIVSDGTSGAVISWSDQRSGSGLDIYAQRVNSSGTIQWTVDGIPIRVGAGEFFYTTGTLAVGSASTVIAWSDPNAGPTRLYAQKINASGVLQWAGIGTLVTSAVAAIGISVAIPENGGAIIAWMDNRVGAGDYNVYAQKINAAGTVQWTINGETICVAPDTQDNVEITTDGSGGAIVSWTDLRTSTNNNIYA